MTPSPPIMAMIAARVMSTALVMAKKCRRMMLTISRFMANDGQGLRQSSAIGAGSPAANRRAPSIV
jgi:hypothetical protein